MFWHLASFTEQRWRDKLRFIYEIKKKKEKKETIETFPLFSQLFKFLFKSTFNQLTYIFETFQINEDRSFIPNRLVEMERKLWNGEVEKGERRGCFRQ